VDISVGPAAGALSTKRQRQEKNGGPGRKGEAESFTSQLPAYIARFGREKMTQGTHFAENALGFSETVLYLEHPRVIFFRPNGIYVLAGRWDVKLGVLPFLPGCRFFS